MGSCSPWYEVTPCVTHDMRLHPYFPWWEKTSISGLPHCCINLLHHACTVMLARMVCRAIDTTTRRLKIVDEANRIKASSETAPVIVTIWLQSAWVHKEKIPFASRTTYRVRNRWQKWKEERGRQCCGGGGTANRGAGCQRNCDRTTKNSSLKSELLSSKMYFMCYILCGHFTMWCTCIEIMRRSFLST